MSPSALLMTEASTRSRPAGRIRAMFDGVAWSRPDTMAQANRGGRDDAV